MKPQRYLISTPGRTGSHIIAQYLYSKTQSPRRFLHTGEESVDQVLVQAQQSGQVLIIHDHSRWLPPKDLRPSTVLIVSDRHDLFDWAVSKLVSRATGEYTHYSGLEHRLELDLDGILALTQDLVHWRQQWRDWQPLNWHSRFWLYYEDLPEIRRVQIPQLDQSFPELRNWHNHMSDRRPWAFQDVVTNYAQLRHEFDQLRGRTQGP